jgi:hypothetical protein
MTDACNDLFINDLQRPESRLIFDDDDDGGVVENSVNNLLKTFLSIYGVVINFYYLINSPIFAVVLTKKTYIMSKIYQCRNCGSKQSTEQSAIENGDSHHNFLVNDDEVSIIKSALIIAGSQRNLMLDENIFLHSEIVVELLNRVNKIRPY